MTFALLAGEIGAGKSALAAILGELANAQVVSVRQELTALLAVMPDDRLAMQRRGAELDQDTLGTWLPRHLESMQLADRVVVDSVRTGYQARAMQRAFPGAKIFYLDAPEAIRRHRYITSSGDPMKAAIGFDRATQHLIEHASDEVREYAELVVDATTNTPAEAARIVLNNMKWTEPNRP